MANTNKRAASRAGGSPEEELRSHYPDLARQLTERRDEITRRVAHERENLEQQVVESPGDVADVSVIDTSADYFLRLANNHQHELVEIQDALDRMRKGTYGICQGCDSPIALERLRRLPFARTCVDCQALRERTGRPNPFPTL